jgi:NtrC-family two-component system sensor histidine kinase KinB
MSQLRLERSYIERRWLKHFYSPHSGLARQVSPSSSSDLAEQLQRRLHGETLDETLDDLQVQIDGEKRLLAYSISGVSHSEGRLMGAMMVLRDVTEQRAVERVRSEFWLRASHALRTPLTGMLMAFSLLQARL